MLPTHSGGPATPRNAGMDHLRARHDLDAIYCLDVDDVPHPRFLEIVSRTMASNPAADLVCTGFRP
ncbi:MAG: glycosyltransferase family A protein [Planctomycetota bacterium]|nr:glycosyltransferase family A protein [Planctomycetota bacterium]